MNPSIITTMNPLVMIAIVIVLAVVLATIAIVGMILLFCWLLVKHTGDANVLTHVPPILLAIPKLLRALRIKIRLLGRSRR